MNPPTEAMTVIGAGIHVHGRVVGEEDLHIEGRIDGSVELTETLFVAATGILVADVRARNVVLSGIIVGNVTADDSVTLNPGAKLVGDLTAPRVIVADGAAFKGTIAMGGSPPTVRRERSRPQVQARPVLASATRAATPRTPPRPAKAAAPATHPGGRVPAILPPQETGGDDDVTVVVRHAALPKDDGRNAAKKKAKKAPPRARVPKPGKRRVSRRS
jgi:cytoskeletal protein CcmA (bactofilin family)